MNLGSIQERKKIFVEELLWRLIQALWDAAPRFENNFKSEGDFLGRCLEGFKELGLVTWEWDAHGNLICALTSKARSESGAKPGMLVLCAFFRETPSPRPQH
jgi:hypothetical protein